MQVRDYRDIYQYSALHLSSSLGFLELTEAILLYRARVMREDGKSAVFDIDDDDKLTMTPLMKASINGHLEVMINLINTKDR